MRKIGLCVLALLCCAELARAVDGDRYTAGTSYADATGAILLCDSKSATGVCFSGTGIYPPPGYTGGRVNFEIAKDTTCASCTVTIRVGSGTDEQHLITSLTCGTNTSYTLPTGVGIAGRIYPEVTAQSACTDLDIVGHFGKE